MSQHQEEDVLSKLERLEVECAHLQREVVDLKEEINRLQLQVLKLDIPQKERHPVDRVLIQRGHTVLSYGDLSHVILPVTYGLDAHTHYYNLLKRYSFRLFLRDVIHTGSGHDWRHVNRYCSLRTAKYYIGFLSSIGLVELEENCYGFTYKGPDVQSFGATLEWYVSEVFIREFLTPALFSVRLKNTRHGGDYDVIALAHGKLVYVEVKSSPPRGVEFPHVEAFLHRLEDLAPDLAFFLVDTELRMKDKIVKLFEEATGIEPKRLIRELFYLEDGIYLVNTRKGIASNIRRCLQHYFIQRRKI